MSYDELRQLIEKRKVKTITDGKNTYKIKKRTSKFKWFWLPNYLKAINKWFNPDKMLQINMFLDNGEHVTFEVVIQNQSFDFKGQSYIVDLSLVYYSLTSKMYCLDYQQSSTIPYRNRLDISKLKQALDDGAVQSKTALNPRLLKRWTDTSLVDKVFSGAELTKKIDMITIMIYIVIGVVIISLFISGYNAYQVTQLIPK